MGISVSDLDQIVVSERVRPSVLLGVMEVAGGGLGFVARFAPVPVREVMKEIVDEASSQLFNDSIRDISASGTDHLEDVKETLKYHRDLKSDRPEVESSSCRPRTEVLFAATSSLSAVLNLSRAV